MSEPSKPTLLTSSHLIAHVRLPVPNFILDDKMPDRPTITPINPSILTILIMMTNHLTNQVSVIKDIDSKARTATDSPVHTIQ
jgi:hypothetical protein